MVVMLIKDERGCSSHFVHFRCKGSRRGQAAFCLSPVRYGILIALCFDIFSGCLWQNFNMGIETLCVPKTLEGCFLGSLGQTLLLRPSSQTKDQETPLTSLIR